MRAAPPRSKPGFAPPTPLQTGTRVGHFEVRGVLGSGTYGIVYRVVDETAGDERALREYLPTHLARREGNTAVVLRSPDDAEPFAMGLRFFTNEGKLLAGIDHPSMVKVHTCWEENGTAYTAMDLFHGRNLQQSMQARWKPASENTLRGMTNALLGALEVLHQGGVQHRDIAPRNVLLGPSGKALLLDLDSPRRVASARGETGDTGPRDGFAPIELYGTGHGLKRGPWTDFYALGATLYFMIAGKPPPPPAERRPSDRVAAHLYRRDGRHSLDLLAVVDWMLAVRPQDRPQNVDQVRAALAGAGIPETYAPKARDKLADTLHRRRHWLWGAVALLLLVGFGLGVRYLMNAESLPWLKPPE